MKFRIFRPLPDSSCSLSIKIGSRVGKSPDETLVSVYPIRCALSRACSGFRPAPNPPNQIEKVFRLHAGSNLLFKKEVSNDY